MLGYRKSRFLPESEIPSYKSTKTLQPKYKINDTEYHHHHNNDDNYDDNNNNEGAYSQYEDNLDVDNEAYFDRDENHHENSKNIDDDDNDDDSKEEDDLENINSQEILSSANNPTDP